MATVGLTSTCMHINCFPEGRTEDSLCGDKTPTEIHSYTSIFAPLPDHTTAPHSPKPLMTLTLAWFPAFPPAPTSIVRK